MNIFTSSFSKAKGLDSSRYFIVSISRFSPRGFSGYKCPSFAPSRGLLSAYKKGLSESAYERRFLYELGSKDSIYSVFRSLAAACGGRDIVLCCYEPAGAFCHRRLIAQVVAMFWNYSINEI